MSIDPLRLVIGGALIVAGFLPIPGAQFLTPIGVSMVLGSITIGGTAAGAALSSRQIGTLVSNSQRSDSPVPVVYGKAKLGALICDKRVDETSTDNEDLYVAAVFCHGSRDGGGIHRIDEIYFNDVLAVDTVDVITGPFTAGTLAVTEVDGASDADWSAAAIGGTDLDTLFSAWAATDTGKGIAGLILKLTYDAAIYTQGVPVVTAIVQGNLVEDNRSEVSGVNQTFADANPDTITRASGSFSTDGYVAGDRVAVSGSASNDGAYTIASVAATVLTLVAGDALVAEGPAGGITLKRWANPATGGGDNPALCVRDYLLSAIYGPGLAASQIDEASFNAMANYYDDLITVPDDATGTRNQARYTCNGWLSTGRSIRANLDELLSCCRGNLIYEGGVYRLFTTRSVTPSTVTLTEDNIVGGMEFTNAGNDEKLNVARATIIDPDKSYQPDTVQWPNAGAANAFLTEDNSFEKRLDVDLPFTNEDHRAENILDIRLSESRQGIKIVLTATEEALQYQIGDVAPVTLETPGWTAKNFWVMGIGLLQNSLVRLALVEYDATSYTHGAQIDAEQEPDTNLPDPFNITVPTGLTLVDQMGQTATGLSIPEILVTWTDVAEAFIKRYDIQAKLASDSIWQQYGEEVQGVEQFKIRGVPLEPGDIDWDVRIRAVNTLGAISAWVEDVVTVDLYDRFIIWLPEREAEDRWIGFPRDTPSDALAIALFETGTGTTIRNAVANTADFTITTGAGSAWIEGPAGGGYDFNETAHAVATHATAFDVGLTTAFTIDIILRWDADAAARQNLVRHDQDYFIELTTTGAIRYGTRDNWATITPGVDLSSNGLDLQGKWVHVHWEYDGADVSTFYINGVLEATDTGSAAASVAAISDDLDIGGNGATERINGAIAFVRVVLGARPTFPFLADVLSQSAIRQIDISIASVFSQTLQDFHILLRGPGVAHGMTALVDADVLGAIGFVSTGGGGLNILGFSDNTTAPLLLQGNMGDSVPGQNPIIVLEAWKESGTGRTAAATVEKILELRAGTTPVFGFTAEGELRIGTGTSDINPDVTVGITMDQGTNIDDFLDIRSSTVAHGMTAFCETDIFFTMKPASAFGGLEWMILKESGDFGGNPTLQIRVVSDSFTDVVKTTAGRGSCEFEISDRSGVASTAYAADENLFVVRNSGTTAFIVDEDGDLYANGTTGTGATVGLFDKYNDAHLVRAFDLAVDRKGLKGLIRSGWDQHVQYNEAALVECGVLGDTVANGGLVCITQLQRLHNGAIWQAYCERQVLRARVAELERLQLTKG